MNSIVLATAVIISATFLLANIGPSSALECYLCTSQDEGCTKDNFKAESVRKQQNCKYCQKTVSSLTGSLNVARGCVPACVETGVGDNYNYCCNDKDLCNSAVKPNNQLPMMIAVALFFGIAIAARLL